MKSKFVKNVRVIGTALALLAEAALARRGRAVRLDYSGSKGAITVFTHSLSQALAEEGIRVNVVAPGPIWAPLIPSTFPAKDVEALAPMFHPVVPVSRSKLR